MITEGSCDTEDWSKDAENSALQLNISTSHCYREVTIRRDSLDALTAHLMDNLQ